MKPAKTVIALLLAAAPPLAAQAPPDTFRLERLFVTATKVPTPMAAVPAHVTVLDGAALRARGHGRVIDALREATGVATAQLGAPGAVASLFLRGGESDYVQVLVDGVQVNDPGGAYDWAHLSTADVERIEIVRGPASVLYGSDAVAGVVQIFTRRGAARTRIAAEVAAGTGSRVGEHAAGTFRTWRGGATVSGGGHVHERWGGSYSLAAARQHSDGAYAFNNQYASTTVSSRVSLASASGGTLDLSARYVDHRFHYPTDGAGNVVDRNRWTAGESLAAGASWSQPVAGPFTAVAALHAYRSDTRAEDLEDAPGQGFSRSGADVARDQLELRIDAHAARNLTVSAGGELERQRGETSFDSDGPFGPYTAASDDERATRALFAQLVHAGRRIGLTAGARLDDSDQFGRFGTARAGMSWQAAPRLRLHASWGTGFKEPTFLETYATGFARGNPALDPEQSRNTELGAQLGTGSLRLALTAFDQRFRNLIQYTATPAEDDAPSYYNVGRARARGFEAELAATVARTLEAGASYTYLHTEVIDAGFGNDMQFQPGQSLLRRPAHSAHASLAWQPVPALTATLAARFTGERADLDFTDPARWDGIRVTLPGHTTVDASLGYSFGSVESTLQVRNALDERYAEVFNFPAPGRVVELGLRVAR